MPYALSAPFRAAFNGSWRTSDGWRSNGWFLLALGGAFGFISVVVAIAYESYWRAPGGIVANDYVTLGRRTVDTGRFEHLSILDYDQIRARVPDAEWAWARSVDQRRIQDEAGAWHETAAREVSANYLAVFGVAAARGQTARSIAGDSAAVISHRLWQRLGGGDLVGMALPLEATGLSAELGSRDRRLIHVAGVAAPRFAGVDKIVDLWIFDPPSADDSFRDGRPNAHVFGAVDQDLNPARLRDLLTEHRFTTKPAPGQHDMDLRRVGQRSLGGCPGVGNAARSSPCHPATPRLAGRARRHAVSTGLSGIGRTPNRHAQRPRGGVGGALGRRRYAGRSASP